MRVIWQFESTTSGAEAEGREELLAQIRKSFDLALLPRPVYEGSAFFHAVPSSDRVGQKLLDLLRDQAIVRNPLLELGLHPPLESAPGKDTAPWQPNLSWRTRDLEGDEESGDWRHHQIYLRPASSGGIDALHAWRFKGGTGKDVRIVDLEWGWDVGHEDLRSVEVTEPPMSSRGHGTQTLGVLCATDDARGITGIAHGATVRLAPVKKDYIQVVDFSSVEEVLDKVTKELGAGDVVLLELEANYRPPAVETAAENLPVEYSPSIRQAVNAAAEKGIYVIEAAGNGAKDLKDFGLDQVNRSAAIMVGAGHPLTRERLPVSNYGARVDVQGWGTGVVTTGDGSLQSHPDPLRCYSQTFRDTSSAAAIVAGAVACLSGVLKANGILDYSPEAMRRLLRSTGTPQGGDTSERIGPLPNLRAAIKRLELETGKAFRRAELA